MDSYVKLQQIFTGISGLQDSVKGLTNILDIFEQFSGKDVVQEILYVTCHCAQLLQNLAGSVFSPKQLKVNELLLMTAANI
jgi:hypothetical protein